MEDRASNLTGRAVGAGAWTVGTKLISKSIDLSILICLARLLGPGEFGIVAAAMAVVLIVEALFEMPTGAALIRVQQLTLPMLHTAFTISVIRGIVIAFLLLILAKPLAAFSGKAELMFLLPALAIAPAARGLVNPRMVEYAKDFNFRPDALLELSGKACAFIASITIAAVTKSYWSIAVATILGPLVSTLISYYLAPIRPKFTLVEWRLFSNLIGWNFLSQFCSALSWQVDRLLLPRLVTNTEFGQYAIAKQISEIPIQAVIQPLARPAMAALSSAGENRASRYLRLTHGVAVIMIPIIGLLVLWPEVIIRIALGLSWMKASEWLRWVGIISMLELPIIFMNPLAMTLQKNRWIAIRSFLELIVRLPVVFLGAIYFGISGAIGGSAISTIIVTFAGLLIINRLTSITLIAQLKNFATPILGLILAGSILHITQAFILNTDDLFELIGITCLFGIVYLIFYIISIFGAWRFLGCPAGIEKHIYDLIAKKLCRQKSIFILPKINNKKVD